MPLIWFAPGVRAEVTKHRDNRVPDCPGVFSLNRKQTVEKGSISAERLPQVFVETSLPLVQSPSNLARSPEKISASR